MTRTRPKVTIPEADRAERGQARLNLRIPRAALEALSAAAKRLNMTRAALVVAAVESYLSKSRKSP